METGLVMRAKSDQDPKCTDHRGNPRSTKSSNQIHRMMVDNPVLRHKATCSRDLIQ